MLRSLLQVVVCAGVLSLVAACTGDGGGGASEPVKPAAADEKNPSIPDVPGGDSGESKEKPPGTGQAGSGEAAPPVTEKSQPNAEAAKKAAESSKDKARDAPKVDAAAGAAPITIKPGEATVKTELLNVRSGPGMKSPVTKSLKKGEKVTVKECKGRWCQIGENEYVGGRFLQQ